MKSDYHSSISVNSLLIYDPSEGTENRNHDAGVNVGGQRMPIYDQPKDLSVLLDPANKYRVGSVVAHGWGSAANVQAEQQGVAVADWHWLAGTITDAYCANKTKHVSRSFLVWTWPATSGSRSVAVIIFDRVSSTNASFEKTFLLHTMDKPTTASCGSGIASSSESCSQALRDACAGTAPGECEVCAGRRQRTLKLAGCSDAAIRQFCAGSGGCKVEVTAGELGSGALSGTFLLPRTVQTKVVGGPGHEYEAGGQNWPPVNAGKVPGLSGQWRLEVSPAEQKQRDDVFLSVWQPHDAGDASPDAPVEVTWPKRGGQQLVGVQLRERLAVFAEGASGLANLTRVDLRNSNGVRSQPKLTLQVCGLQPGAWVLSPQGGAHMKLGAVSAPDYCLYVVNLQSAQLEGVLELAS